MADFVERTGRSTLTILLRIVATSAEHGSLVGHAEVVDTGELVAIDSCDSLADLARRLAH